MKPLSTSEKEKILSRLFWDVEKRHIYMDELLDEKLRTIEDIESRQFFSRLLMSCDWYTLLKLIPAEKLKLILNNAIINSLFPKSLKDKYTYVRNVLSRHPISASR